MKTIVIGSDHAGFVLKEALKRHLEEAGWTVRDFGTHSEQSMDYPDVAHPVAQAVQRKETERAVLVCGSGNGVSMVANKYPQVRAALCWRPDLAVLARQHNDANVLSLPARFISEKDAMDCLDAFLQTAFEGGRHEMRVKKISSGIQIDR
ncbi:MAG: ribose 5-phosphate isomerase B [Bacteroidales bacterium]|nr:ribose 5-phosphate isomerase B [Bacteroidales bacterium]